MVDRHETMEIHGVRHGQHYTLPDGARHGRRAVLTVDIAYSVAALISYLTSLKFASGADI